MSDVQQFHRKPNRDEGLRELRGRPVALDPNDSNAATAAGDARMAGTGAVSSASGEFNLGLGVAGAVGGALVGMGLMYGFYAITGLRFPLLGCGTGLLSGLAAKWLFKGSDHTLGIISGGAAMLGVLGALLLMYGLDFSPLNIISVVVSASVAYKIASR